MCMWTERELDDSRPRERGWEWLKVHPRLDRGDEGGVDNQGVRGRQTDNYVDSCDYWGVTGGDSR